MCLKKTLEGRVNSTFLGVFRLSWTSYEKLTLNLSFDDVNEVFSVKECHTVKFRGIDTFNPIQYGLFFRNTTVMGDHYGPPNFIVSSSITIKFGVLIEFTKFSPK